MELVNQSTVMGSLGNPKAWVPYVTSKDCSQGFCSLYCPQWCYIIFPPPPPPSFEFTSDSSSPKLSPLVIAIIGILASAFLLVSYYTIISKYCGNTTRREIDDVAGEELEHNNHNPSFHDHDHEPWHVPITRGLDEALIKSITVCKYNKGDGLIEGTDCSVCLSEFEEDESVRLLPKCSHAFHVPCIDTWLKSHSNCPLCRANIFFINASPPLLPPIATTDHHQAPRAEGTSENEAADHEQEDIERGINVAAEGEVLLMSNEIPKTPFRAFSFSDLGNLQVAETMIEIADNEGHDQQFTRSVSMDHSIQNRVSVANIIDPFGAGSSKQSQEIGKSSHRNKLRNMHYCAINHVSMKRSFTSGRFSVLNRQRRLRDTIIPL